MTRRKPTEVPRKQWSFAWLCPHCDHPQIFLVNEIVGQISPVMARCAVCTTLLTVRESHRQASRDFELG